MAIDPVGGWAAEKLDRLGKYLNAYTTILKNQKWCKGYYYIDAFAGPGQLPLRAKTRKKTSSPSQLLLEISQHATQQEEQRKFLDGSPKVALDIQHPFSGYVFLERSPERIALLNQLKAEYGKSRAIAIREVDCRKYLQEQVARNPKINWVNHRAVIFLDPYGMQVDWDVLAALASTKAIEIFLNLPVGMAIQRLIPRDPDKLTPEQRLFLDNYFGSGEWFDVMYRTRKTLFEEDLQEKINESGKTLLDWYRKRLCSIFPHVSKAALIRNTRGAHLYYLLLGSPKQKAVEIANDILSVGEVL